MASPTADSGWRSLDRRQRRVLASTLLTNALVFFDQTAVIVALPAIGREFGATAGELQWTITSYLLALAVFMLLAGRVADHYGRRRTFLVGLVLFGTGSALCAAAPTLPLLLAARFAQGIGGAIVQPLALGNTTRAVDDAQRGWAVGLFATGGTAFLALGPLIAGVLLAVDWRWLFLVNLPVVAVALVLARSSITPSREPEPEPIAWTSAVLLLVGLGAVVFGIVTAGELGLPGIIALGAGVFVLGTFILVERRSTRPLIDLALLRDPMLFTSLAALFAIQFAVFGVTVPLALYLQHGLGLSALAAGVLLAVAGLGTPLLSLRAGRAADRRGPRVLVVPGLALATAGLLCLALLAPVGGVLVLLPGLLLFAVARPVVFTPAGTGPFLALGAGRRAFAASLATEARQLGAVFGVALTTAAGTAAYGPTLPEGDPELVQAFRAAVIVTTAVCALVALAAWRWMPRRPG